MQLQEFDAEQLHAIGVFVQDKIPFYIPIYQRRYNWTFEKEVSQLISDLRNFQDDSLHVDGSSYYLGNIIVKAEIDPITEAKERYVLIDGQQRMTTILLMIKVLKYHLEEINKKNLIEDFDKRISSLEKILFIVKEGVEGGDISLKIENPESQSVLNKIFRLSNDEEIKDRAVLETNYYKNYEGLKELINIGNIEEWDKWLLTLKKVKIVKVTLGVNDKEISVFESINSKGLPLNTLDLIRNYLFLVAENNNINEVTKKRINEILTDKLEPKFTKNSTGIKDEKKINRFFSAHIAKETLNDNTKQKDILYKAYKDMFPLKINFDQFDENLNKLERDVQAYSNLLTLSNDFIKKPMSNQYSKAFLSESKLELYLPLLLIIEEKKFKNEIDDEEIEKIFNLLDLHNFALAIADKRNSDNRFIFKYISNNGGNISYESLIEYLTNNPGNKSRLPSRREVEDGFVNTKIYEKNPKIAKYILYRIENDSRNKSDEYIEFDYSLEHVFPQSDKNWKDNFNNFEYKDKFIHNIGNLTLVKKKLNLELSNSPWATKKGILSENSSLKINDMICVEENWNVFEDDNSITKRSNELIGMCEKIWPFEILDKVVLNEDGISERDEDLDNLLSRINKLTIVEAMKIIMFCRYGEFLKLDEIKEELIDLYDYVNDSEFDIDISFSREKISTGGWMTERLSNNQVDKENKTDRYQKPIFIKDNDNKTWTISDEVFSSMS